MIRALLIATILMHTPGIGDGTDLDRVVATERAFARTAAEKGIRDSFLEYLHPDALTFPPEHAIRIGTEYIKARPASPALLSWEPRVADVSAAGDLGFTTGPWQLRPAGAGGDVAAFGHYATIWKRQGDGTYRAVVDGGASGSPPIDVPGGLEPRVVKVPVNPTSTDLTALESALAASIANLGEGKALALLARDRTVVHREGRNSAVGKAAIGQLPSDPVEYRWTLARSEVATSGDLGYTCGTAEIITKDGVVRQNTLRIWTRDGDGRWILAVDVAIPGEKPAAPR